MGDTPMYEVTTAAIYKWLHKFGKLLPGETIIVQKQSEQHKTKELMKRVAELERTVGQQQMQLIYKDAVIDCGSDLLGEDIEKKYNSQQ